MILENRLGVYLNPHRKLVLIQCEQLYGIGLMAVDVVRWEVSDEVRTQTAEVKTIGSITQR